MKIKDVTFSKDTRMTEFYEAWLDEVLLVRVEVPTIVPAQCVIDCLMEIASSIPER